VIVVLESKHGERISALNNHFFGGLLPNLVGTRVGASHKDPDEK